MGERARVDGGIVERASRASCALPPPCCDVYFGSWSPERSSSPMKVQEYDVGQIIKERVDPKKNTLYDNMDLSTLLE